MAEQRGRQLIPGAERLGGGSAQATPTQDLLQMLLSSSVVSSDDWKDLAAPARSEFLQCLSSPVLLSLLVHHRLLTEYQADCAAAGNTFGLVLGHYRVLEPLRKGTMALVFRAEHRRLKQQVAIKVLPLSAGQRSLGLQRFDAEVRAIAQLQHPHIVRALDAGEAAQPDPSEPVLHYYVMEYIDGQNLEDLVTGQGPLPVASACNLIHQVASALAEAHKHQLVHRDIKPPNVMVTRDGQAKLLDFGLVRQCERRVTRVGTILGTLAYIAPEQTRDAGSVDIRADIYGLGGTLFWCLTGRPPFDLHGSFTDMVRERRTLPPPSVRDYRPEVPAELDAIVAGMMALRPAERYRTPQAVMEALEDFLSPEADRQEAPALSGAPLAALPLSRRLRVLVVEDNHDSAESMRTLLTLFGHEVTVANSGPAGMEAAKQAPPDVVVCDIGLPGMDGYGVAHALRHDRATNNARLIAVTGHGTDEDRRQAFAAGFDDHFVKPLDPEILLQQIRGVVPH